MNTLVKTALVATLLSTTTSIAAKTVTVEQAQEVAPAITVEFAKSYLAQDIKAMSLTVKNSQEQAFDIAKNAITQIDGKQDTYLVTSKIIAE